MTSNLLSYSIAFEKGSTLKRKEFAPNWSKFFPMKEDPFQQRT